MDYTELFDRYIDGLLEGKELEDFNKKLRTDKDFRQALEKYFSLNEAAAEAVRERSGLDEESQIDESVDKSSLQDIFKYGKAKRGEADEQTEAFNKLLSRAEKDSLNTPFRSFARSLPLRLAVAATVIVAVLITLFILIKQNKYTSGALFTRFYKPYVGTEEVMEITRSSDNFYYAIKVFEAGDYGRALVMFDELADTVELKVYASFYSALTLMQMARWEEAVKKFEEVIQFGETQVEKPAHWYLGLCFLRLDNSGSARPHFEILASSRNEYTARARRILRLMH